MSVAVRIRPLTRWSLARRFISVASVSDWAHTQRHAVHTESNNALENEHRSFKDGVRTSAVLLS